MSERKSYPGWVPFSKGGPIRRAEKSISVFLLAVVLVAIVYLVIPHIGTFGNVLLVVLGFGAVVLVHEFGHFVFAKLSDIKVEAFSIGFPPTFLGILRTEEGYRVRILPDFFKSAGDESGKGDLVFTFGKKGQAGQTEYRIGLIPFGGFVKMLGQEDVGSAEASDDPRSFANKPVISRMAVIAAGVLFNVVSALIVFMMVFLIGIKLPPAVIGAVMPDSPAAEAGLRAGDEIIEIDGDRDNLDFSSIAVAAALSNEGKKVELKVRHEDGSIEDFSIAAKQLAGERLKGFGVYRPMSLAIAKVSDADELFEQTGLVAGDRIKAINGKDVQSHWQLDEVVKQTLAPAVTILAERKTGSDDSELIESEIPLTLGLERGEVESESELEHIYSMVPRLRVSEFSSKVISRVGGTSDSLKDGDIILAAGDIENPTYKQFREVTTAYKGKKLAIKVLRVDADGVERVFTETCVPRRLRDSNRVGIGIVPVYDGRHPVVAKTIGAKDGPEKLDIPRGAVITAVNGEAVSDFYDIINEIRRNTGKRVTIDYQLGEKVTGGVSFEAVDNPDYITVRSYFDRSVPFEDLKRLYKAGGPIEAMGMGYKRTVMFIAQTYVTLRRLVGGLVSPKDLMGPVGIVSFSYRIVSEQPLIYYVYFLGLISACVAVFNFLPLPPLDGGFFVLLLVEKVRGSAVSQQAQAVIAYAGWILIGSFFLYVTFNDIVRSFFR